MEISTKRPSFDDDGVALVSLDQLPDDIINHIIYYTTPVDNLEIIHFLSHRFYRLANNRLLWRNHCLETFRYWNTSHRIPEKCRLRASEVDWKKIFIQRKTQNDTMANILAEIIRSRVGRRSRMSYLCSFGYDAKDFLLEQIHSTSYPRDNLARIQYCRDVLNSIHRSLAVDEWQNVTRSRNTDELPVPRLLERSLAAFDMFVLHDDEGDINEISSLFNQHAANFRATQSQWDGKSTRQKALALNDWLRQENLTGIRVGDFGNLRNSLIGQALRHDLHESNPNISCSIFCSIAERVGLSARCYLAPMMVHVVVFAPLNLTLDGLPSSKQEYMFLDPWGTEGEVPIERLDDLTSRFELTVESLLNTGTPSSVTERTANNIEFCSVQQLRHTPPSGTVARLLKGNDGLNLHACLYAVKWARVLFAQPFTLLWSQRASELLSFALQHYPEDSWLVRRYGRSLARTGASQPGLFQIEAFEKNILAADRMLPAEFHNPITSSRVEPFRIGQVFSHKRYGWMGVITGFHEVEPRSREQQLDVEREISSMPSHEENRGRFYVKCFRTDGMDQALVAPANIEIITDASLVLDGGMFPLAGRYFKRFDQQACQFVSNLEEEYPNL